MRVKWRSGQQASAGTRSDSAGPKHILYAVESVTFLGMSVLLRFLKVNRIYDDDITFEFWQSINLKVY
jgi:hypothetical protein